MRAAFGTILVLALLALGTNAQGPAADGPAPKLSVTGSGTVTTSPDLGKIFLSVTVGKPTVSGACDVAANVTDAVVTAAEDSGKGVTVSTDNISVQPNITYGENGKELRSGFICQQSLKVTVQPPSADDLDSALGGALDAALAAGGDYLQVSSLVTDLSPELRRKATNQAREIAVEDAQGTAAVLAKSAGVTLGDVVSITDSNVAPPSPVPIAMPAGGAAMDSAAVTPTPVQTGTTDVVASVAIDYAISSA